MLVARLVAAVPLRTFRTSNSRGGSPWSRGRLGGRGPFDNLTSNRLSVEERCEGDRHAQEGRGYARASAESFRDGSVGGVVLSSPFSPSFFSTKVLGPGTYTIERAFSLWWRLASGARESHMPSRSVSHHCGLSAERYWALKEDPEWDAFNDSLDGNERMIASSTRDADGVRTVSARIQAKENPIPPALRKLLGVGDSFSFTITEQYHPDAFDASHPATFETTPAVLASKIKVGGVHWVEPAGPDACTLFFRLDVNVAVMGVGIKLARGILDGTVDAYSKVAGRAVEYALLPRRVRAASMLSRSEGLIGTSRALAEATLQVSAAEDEQVAQVLLCEPQTLEAVDDVLNDAEARRVLHESVARFATHAAGVVADRAAGLWAVAPVGRLLLPPRRAGEAALARASELLLPARPPELPSCCATRGKPAKRRDPAVCKRRSELSEDVSEEAESARADDGWTQNVTQKLTQSCRTESAPRWLSAEASGAAAETSRLSDLTREVQSALLEVAELRDLAHNLVGAAAAREPAREPAREVASRRRRVPTAAAEQRSPSNATSPAISPPSKASAKTALANDKKPSRAAAASKRPAAKHAAKASSKQPATVTVQATGGHEGEFVREMASRRRAPRSS